MKKLLIMLFAALVLNGITPTQSNAVMIVSTLPQTASNSTGVGGTNDYAAGFTWASSSLFGYAELYMGIEGTPGAALNVSIYDDNGGSPGSFVQDLIGVNPTTASLYTYTGTTALTQDANYWLVLSTGIYSDLDNEYIWYDGTFGDPNYITTMWRRPATGDWSVSGIVAPAAFSVNSTDPIPEPATMLLLGSGLIGLAGFRRKKNLKK